MDKIEKKKTLFLFLMLWKETNLKYPIVVWDVYVESGNEFTFYR
jgi:hypothetical protein